MRILITGGSGFVGRHLIPRLSHHDVIAPTREELDLGKSPDTWKLPKDVDIVIHAAAQIDAGDPSLMARINVQGTKALVRWASAAGAPLFLFLSTGGVYGPRVEPADERQSLRPDGPYAETKAAAERAVLSEEERMVVQVARLYFPFGPGQEGRLIPRLAHSIAAATPVEIAGEVGGPFVTVTYIDDLVEAIVRVMALETSIVVNIGSETVTVQSLAVTIGDLIGIKPRFTVRCEGAERNYAANTDLLRRRTGFVPSVPLREALHRTLGVSRGIRNSS
jgi:UDP-glucose 4-epimerase